MWPTTKGAEICSMGGGGDGRFSANTEAPKEKVYVILNTGCLDWDYPESNRAAGVVKPCAQRGEALCVCLDWKQMPAL